MGDFTMPSLGADMESGTVAQWLVHPGDQVHRGDIMAVVETEKSDIEVEVFEDGTIDAILVPEGARVPVGTPLARVATAPASTAPSPGEVALGPPVTAPSIRKANGTTAHEPAMSPVLSPMLRHLAEHSNVDLAHLHGSGPRGAITRADVEGAAYRATSGGRVASSPLARHQAAALGIDLSTLQGSGPGGAVLEDDVRRAAQAATSTGTVATTEPPATTEPAPQAEPAPTGTPRSSEDRRASLRRSIGVLMARSKREIPHYYLSTSIDCATAVAWLEERNGARAVEERLVLPVLLLKATALAVATVPEVNGVFVDDAFVPSDGVHIGVAVSLRGGGVVAPAIHDVDHLTLDELMHQLGDLVGRARHGRLRAAELHDPTITVTNLGDLGVETVFGVIYPPQVALVGFGRLDERPYAKDGMFGVRPVLTATLSADHRVSDGHRGGRFLSAISHLLQEPDAL